MKKNDFLSTVILTILFAHNLAAQSNLSDKDHQAISVEVEIEVEEKMDKLGEKTEYASVRIEENVAASHVENTNKKTMLLEQERATGLKKNVVYGTAGFALVWVAANINYERLLYEGNSGFFKSIWVRIGGGGWADWERGGSHFVGGITGLTGAGKHHFEIHAGITSLFDKQGYDIEVSDANYFSEPKPSKSEYRDILPSGAIGYRLQKPGGSFILRTGLSFPESLYLSLGFCF